MLKVLSFLIGFLALGGLAWAKSSPTMPIPTPSPQQSSPETSVAVLPPNSSSTHQKLTQVSASRTGKVGEPKTLTFTVSQQPAIGRYYRIKLKVNGQYLDADHCSNHISLNPGSDYADGACQLWQFVP